RVLYHEGFHQYIYYSVGDFDPHSWFNEGDGDYFFGFNFEGGKWTRGINTWRKDGAAKNKREWADQLKDPDKYEHAKRKFPAFWEWLHWNQAEYYGSNKNGITIGDNYEMGWDFIYFLRTTKKKEYQGILQRYFDTLKGCVTAARKVETPSGKPDGPDPKDP